MMELVGQVARGDKEIRLKNNLGCQYPGEQVIGTIDLTPSEVLVQILKWHRDDLGQGKTTQATCPVPGCTSHKTSINKASPTSGKPAPCLSRDMTTDDFVQITQVIWIKTCSGRG